MSTNNLYSPNDSILYCDEMHCNNIIPNIPGAQGDLYTVNSSNQSVFSKIIDGLGPAQPLQFKNAPVQVLSDNGLAPAILGVGADPAHGFPAILGLGNMTTQDSFFFSYDDTAKELRLSQNNGAINGNYEISLGTGNFGLIAQNANMSTDDIEFGKIADHLNTFTINSDLTTTNGSNLVHNDSNITIGGNNCVVTAPITLQNQVKDSTSSAGLMDQFLKTDGINVTWSDLPSVVNIYTADGIISDATRTLDGNGADLIFNNISTYTDNSAKNHINASSEVVINTPTLQLTQLTNGLLQVNGSGIVSTASSNYISSYLNTTPGAGSTIVPANAKIAKISAVGGGGSGANAPSVNGLGGGGAGGAIVEYPISVAAGQTINVVVGAGGATNNTNGANTTINMGTFTITCTGGQCGQIANPTGAGGLGGSVVLPIATTAGGAGGSGSVGTNGNVGAFAYSGAGGGSGTDGGTSFAGGAQLLFTGGSANSRQGGGGASAFANGGSYNVSGGSLGSGGPANVNGIVAGGNGFIEIAFYS